MDWYKIDEVKEMVFDLLLENNEMRKKLGGTEADKNYWWHAWQDANEKVQNLTAELEDIRKQLKALKDLED